MRNRCNLTKKCHTNYRLNSLVYIAQWPMLNPVQKSIHFLNYLNFLHTLWFFPRVKLVSPSGIFLPGTELLQSPFSTEFTMGSRSWWYRRSLRRHRRFLRSYRRFLRSYRRSLRHCRDPWGYLWPRGRRMPMVAWLAKNHKTLLNIVKHHETLLKHCETSWNTRHLMRRSMRTRRRSMWRRLRLGQRRRRSRGGHSMRRRRRLMRRLRRSRGVTGDIGAEFPAISAIAELV